ncbi:MAG: hypothetical protein SVZ03_07865 [Spirochaetota bacterium]|nr:hypothetical protein [Spirochaetota bacterium]
MSLKCNKCEYEGPRNEFRILYRASDPGPDLYRQCPKCKQMVYSDELQQDEESSTNDIWGISSLRGKVFRRRKNVNEDNM